MPPTLVRPQTFTVFQQPDSASPAVRFLSKQNTYSIGVRPGCANPLPCQLIPVCQLFCAVAVVCANFDVRLSVPVVWVGQRPKELYHVMLQLTTKLNWRSAFPPNGVAVGLHAEKTDEVKPLYCNRYFTNYWM